MSPDLDKQLCDKYPKIFANRYKSPQESCLAFGIECGDGWYDIIDHLCDSASSMWTTSFEVDKEDAIKLAVEKNSFGGYFVEVPAPQMVASQVKEKFGTLRFYYHLDFEPNIVELNNIGKYPDLSKIVDRYYSYFDGMVHMAEAMSARTCEMSGQKGEMHVSGGTRFGWYKTLNPELAKTRQDLVDREYVPVSMLDKEEELP
jgi:hypothetical protein